MPLCINAQSSSPHAQQVSHICSHYCLLFLERKVVLRRPSPIVLRHCVAFVDDSKFRVAGKTVRILL